MLKRFAAFTAASLIAVAASLAPAQFGPPDMSPEQLQMMQEMQEVGPQLMQNMQNAGIDMMEFGQRVQQQMADGTFDPADLQQELIDKGVLDKALMTRMQSTMSKFTLSSIKQQLHATDEEWTVLEPKIQGVVIANADANEGVGAMQRPSAMMGGFMRGVGTVSDVAKALKDLRATLKEESAPPEKIAQKLRALRTAREKANAKLDLAQKDLREVLTLRQEALLMQIGILE